MHSHHSHSGEFCAHAVGSLADVVQVAITRGFAVYGLSEHVPRYRTEDLYPEEKDVSPKDLLDTFDKYIVEAHRLRVHHSHSISLLVGLETDYITSRDLDGLEELLQRHGDSIEYLVGSVHHVNETPIDFDPTTFTKALHSLVDFETSLASPSVTDLEPLISAYLDAQYTLMERFHPEIIGHFDLFRLYHPSVQLDKGTVPALWSKVERNIRFAISYGALFEFNAASFRKGWEQGYPGRDIAQLIISHGGRFALSDDSHGPDKVGLNYGRLRTYIREVLGVRELWYLSRSRERNTGGRLIKATRVEGDWSSHTFWTQFVTD